MSSAAELLLRPDVKRNAVAYMKLSDESKLLKAAIRRAGGEDVPLETIAAYADAIGALGQLRNPGIAEAMLRGVAVPDLPATRDTTLRDLEVAMSVETRLRTALYTSRPFYTFLDRLIKTNLRMGILSQAHSKQHVFTVLETAGLISHESRAMGTLADSLRDALATLVLAKLARNARAAMPPPPLPVFRTKAPKRKHGE